MQPHEALELAGRAIGLGVGIGSLELHAARRLYAPGGLLDWQVLRFRTTLTAELPTWLFGSARHLRTYFLLRASLGFLVAFAPGPPAVRGALLLLAGGLLADWNLRMPYGQDGSDQMLALGAIVVGMGLLVGQTQVESVCCWFLTSLLLVAYATAGLSKLLSPAWRENALAVVLRTRVYGHPTFHRLFSGRAGRLASPLVGAGELLFPLALLAPLPVAAVTLALFVGFHLLTAVAMGLNLFVISFVALYPCVIACNEIIWR